jgi:diguanylate cyclase (GGDEF)-like protein
VSASTAQSDPPVVRDDAVLARLEAELKQGHRRLRFAPELEAAFQSDGFAARRWMLALLAVVGLLGYLVVSGNDLLLAPDLADHAQLMYRITVWGGMASIVAGMLLTWRWRKSWIFEALTAGNTLVLNLIIVWMGVSSRADAAVAHTAMITGVVMYACIAVRLRFYWALGSCAISVLAFAALVHGHTPWQAMVARGNLTLIALTTVFALAVNYSFEYAERRNWLLRQIERRQRARLLDDTLRLQRLSTEDPLTALPNRRQFDVDLQRAWARAEATRQPLALVLLDVDHFKAYNDSHGHPEGDACLRQLAGVLAHWAEVHQAQVARLGGEEFALLLPGRRGAAAATVAQDLCEAVAALQRPHHASPVAGHVTVSAGVAEARPRRGLPPQALLRAADTALYQAKDSGRNRVCLAPPAALAGPGHRLAPDAGAPQATPPQAAEPFEWPALAPDPAAMPRSAAVRQWQSLLNKGMWRLRFPQAIERTYLDHGAESRRKHVWRSALLALGLFNAYLFGSTAHFADVGVEWFWALAGLSGVMVGGVVAGSSSRVSPWQREAIYSLGICVMAVASIWMLSQSQLDAVFSFVACMVLMPLFAGAGARLPFWFAVPPAVVTVAAVALLFEPRTPLAQLLFHDSLVSLANASLYPLVAAYALDHAARKRWLLGRIAAEQHEALLRLGGQLQELSMTDALTTLPNRRQFELSFEQAHALAVGQSQPLAVMVVDVDHFKRYNDGYGHPAGDACLQDIAQALSRVAQASQAQVARLGGEEFGLLLQADPTRARRVADLVCAMVRDRRIPHAPSGNGQPGEAHVTVSVGLACAVPTCGMGLLDFLALADAALYQAKAQGRNRVVEAQAKAAVDTPTSAPHPHPHPA